MRNDGKTLVRLAYGRFYQYLPQGSLRNELGISPSPATQDLYRRLLG